jgi:glycosidase
MKFFFNAVFLMLLVFTNSKMYTGSIIFKEKDAIVWQKMQSIAGRISDKDIHDIKLHCNNVAYPVSINVDNTFKVMVKLNNGDNKIWATGTRGNLAISSAVLNFKLGYHPLPDVLPYATIGNNKVVLNAMILDTTGFAALKYQWTESKVNPAKCSFSNKYTQSATVIIPPKRGTYYFNLRIRSGTDSVNYKTYVVRDKISLHAYNLDKDHAAWIDSAVIYEINPSVFVKGGTYDAITAKLAEIKSLGINTLWLQPVYETNDPGQGYSVTDYFKLRSDYGTEKQLANLIVAAKKLHLRVIFDFVPNHTSLYHPYAQDCIKHGDSSHYYHFYQRELDDKPYSSFYHKDENRFVYYFWKYLVNLDYNNPEVQQWIIEATRYYINKYDIDGYRFDAMWGINARSPQFTKRLNAELKAVKPDILLLAEDKSSDKTVYESGLDAAYDWTADTSWVSQWIWQTHHDQRKSLTIFNSPDTQKVKSLLRKSIFSNASINHTGLRFIENNDVPRFIAMHTVSQTKMAAELMFALPGIPMLYNGQEVGFKLYPYSPKTIFTAGSTIQQTDSTGMFPFYKKLIHLRLQYPALYGKSIREIQLPNSPFILAFERTKGNQHFIVIINLSGATANACLNYKNIAPQLTGKITLEDVLTNRMFTGNKNKIANIKIAMNGYSTRWLLIKNIN